VGDVAARLDREAKRARHLTASRRSGIVRGQAVEGLVDLDRVEPPSIVPVPTPRGEPFGIESPLPVILLPARRPDPSRS
jgi:hypothetical protein